MKHLLEPVDLVLAGDEVQDVTFDDALAETVLWLEVDDLAFSDETKPERAGLELPPAHEERDRAVGEFLGSVVALGREGAACAGRGAYGDADAGSCLAFGGFGRCVGHGALPSVAGSWGSHLLLTANATDFPSSCPVT